MEIDRGAGPLSKPPPMPRQVRVTALLDDQPFQDAWLALNLNMSLKNDYGLLFGPTDAAGELVISDDDLQEQIQRQLDLFPMDYASPKSAWTGSMRIRVLNRSDVANLQMAYDTWKDLDLYPEDLPSHLSRLDALLSANEGCRLSARADVPGGEGVVIDTMDQTA